MFASVIMLLFVCVAMSFNLVFDEDHIKARFLTFTYKKIPYSKVEGIAIKGACRGGRYGSSPDLDEHKKQQAALVLYDTKFYNITSKGGWDMASSFGALCCCYLDTTNLKVLLEKTKLSIYITEQMLNVHQEQLNEILTAYPDRFVVAYYDVNEAAEKKMPYKKYHC